MRTYSYKGYDSAGVVQRGYIEALHAKSACEQLASKGVYVAKLQEGGVDGGVFKHGLRGMFYRELAALLRSGMPLVPALSMLLETAELRPAFGILSSVRDQVREGSGFAAALSLKSKTVRPFEVSAIDVAERTGTLEAVLDQLAQVVESGQQIRERLQRAMIYPVLILVLGGLVGVVMLGVLLPRMQDITGGYLSMPLLTRVVLRFGDVLFPWGMLVGLMVAILVGFWVKHALLVPEQRIRIELILLRLPGQKLYRYLLASRFAQTLSILSRAGVPLVDGVALAGRATGSSWCARCAAASSETVRHGQNLEDAVRAIPPIADILGGWVAVGEAGGDLAGMLDHAASRCDRLFDHHLARFLTFVEPVLLLLVGGFVLIITLAVLLPVFSLTDAVLQ